MKKICCVFLVAVALLFAACREKNDLLTRIFMSAFKLKEPLAQQTDALWQPLIGYYLLEDERVVSITKKDAKTYNVEFLKSSLNGSGMSNTATTCMVGKTRFFNLLSYQNNFLYFRVKTLNDSTYSIDFVSDNVKRVIGDTANAAMFRRWWTKTGESMLDDNMIFNEYKLRRMSEKDALAYHKKQIRNSVYNMSDFEKYASLYPDDADLDIFRNEVLKNCVNRCSDISCLAGLMQGYPEIADEALVKGKTLCTTTTRCIAFVETFPKDTSAVRIKSLAFDLATSTSDIEKLIEKFPADPRSAKLQVKLLHNQIQDCETDEDYARLNEKYASDPRAIKIINTFKVFNQMSASSIEFNKGSHVLTADGKKALDKVANFISMANADGPVLEDVFFAVNAFDGVDSLPTNVAYVVAMNRCLSVKNYLATKNLQQVNLHFIPTGNGIHTMDNNGTVVISCFDRAMKKHRDAYRKWSFTSGQTLVVPDGKFEFTNTDWISEESYLSYVSRMVDQYLATYKKGSAIEHVIPVEFWLDEYATDKKAMQQFRDEVKSKAKKAGIKKKAVNELAKVLQ